MDNTTELLKNISPGDIEKLKIIVGLFTTKPAVTPGISLGRLKNEYKQYVRDNRSDSYRKSVELAFEHLTDYMDESTLLTEIRVRDIEMFLALTKQNAEKGYVVYYRNLKAAFNKAIDWGYLESNVFVKIKIPKRQKTLPGFLSKTELGKICDLIRYEDVRQAVVFGFYTGMRLNEITNLRWINIDLENRCITVGDEKFTTKSKNQRFIPICEEVLEIILDRIASLAQSKKRKRLKIAVQSSGFKNSANNDHTLDHEKLLKYFGFDFIFCKGNGKKYSGNYFSKIFKKATNSAGINKNIHFHSLRHSFASNLVQRGVPLSVIKDLLGHSTILTTEIYSHINIDSLRDAIGKLEEPRSPRELEKHCPSAKASLIPPGGHTPSAEAEGKGSPLKQRKLMIYSIDEGGR